MVHSLLSILAETTRLERSNHVEKMDTQSLFKAYKQKSSGQLTCTAAIRPRGRMQFAVKEKVLPKLPTINLVMFVVGLPVLSHSHMR